MFEAERFAGVGAAASSKPPRLSPCAMASSRVGATKEMARGRISAASLWVRPQEDAGAVPCVGRHERACGRKRASKEMTQPCPNLPCMASLRLRNGHTPGVRPLPGVVASRPDVDEVGVVRRGVRDLERRVAEAEDLRGAGGHGESHCLRHAGSGNARGNRQRRSPRRQGKHTVKAVLVKAVSGPGRQ